MTSLKDTYAEDRRKLHEMAVRYGNAAITGAGEVAFLLNRAEKQIKLMEDDLEKGLQIRGANGGGVSRGSLEHAGHSEENGPQGGTSGGGTAANGDSAEQGASGGRPDPEEGNRGPGNAA